MANHQITGSSSASANYDYDVFINHRGPDVKKTFASHLYRRLLSYGFRVFLDQQEMQEGENLSSQIEGAIATASVHVAIFSRRYAESKWCLDELVLMLKSGATVIPVFYHVKPSELRWTRGKGKRGVYAKALRKLEETKRHATNTVENWREALSLVSEISGLELDTCNGDEGELVDKVLQLVQKKARKPPLDVARYPTGLDEKLEDFESTVLPHHHRGETNVVGIVGIGGVGKTTLAKQFFNQRRSDYNRSCFLFDVRETVTRSRSSLTSLQSKLFECLSGRDQVMNSIAEGIAMLKHCVPRSQALIILDDVDSVEQIEGLYSPLMDALSSGSLIVITSRSNNVLISSGIKESSIYKVAGLNKEHSQELFCLHAFHQPCPVVGFEELVRGFLHACQGLPLSLKVIGALLYLESPVREYWKVQLHRISKVLPSDIQSTLRISYDILDEQEKNIFLDIACFFIGEDKDKAIRIWNGSDWEGSISFQNLESKNLVEVDSENCIRMHDHLRDLGRALAETEPRRRIWQSTDLLHDAIHANHAIHHSCVRGINIQTSALSTDIGSQFVDMPGLQLLGVQGDWSESLSNLLKRSNLLWLRWNISSFNRMSEHVSYGGSEIVSSSHGCSEIASEIASSSHGCSEIASEIVSSSRYGCSEIVFSHQPCHSSLPSCIPMKNLRVLEVVGGEIQLETLWESESKAPLQLRELNIVGHDHIQIPTSIGRLKRLEKVQLIYPVKTLPKEFFDLRSLTHLRMLTSMKLLPDSLGNLTNLQHLNLSSCHDLQSLPYSFGKLTNLQYLNLYGCSNLEMLPNSFGNLILLKQLYLKGCSELTLSSEALGSIRTLEILDFSDCQKLEVLPPQVTHQSSLKKLILWNTNLKELPSAIGYLCNLEILKVSFKESSVEMLPLSLGNLKSLKQLILFGGKCKCLLDSIGKLKQLTDLTIDCGIIKFLPEEIRELNNLQTLKVIKCPVSEVPFGRVKKVGGRIAASADQSGRRFLDSSVHKCMLLRLKHLDLHGTRIEELLFAEGVCPNLKKLDISDCLKLVNVGTLPTTLISLDLNGCDTLKNVTGLRGLAKLRTLDMRKCEAVEDLPGLETLTSLAHLRVSGCKMLKNIRGLAQATNFQTPKSHGRDNDGIEDKLFRDLWLWTTMNGLVNRILPDLGNPLDKEDDV